MNPELLIRSAKLGSDWGRNELAAYNISMEPQDAPTFFEVDPLPEPHVPADMLNKVEAEETTNLDASRTISAMDLAMNATPLEESASTILLSASLTFLAIRIVTFCCAPGKTSNSLFAESQCMQKQMCAC